METLFGQRVRERMKVVGLEQQKELASALADATRDAANTCTAKLSKLLHGDREGRAWLEAGRLPALAAALRVDEATVRVWLEESDNRVELVLDPRLPAQVQSYLRERADGVRSIVVEGPAGRLERTEIDAWLRDEAKKLRRPLVVLHSASEAGAAAFFAGAELPTTTTRQHPRGWILSAEPDLIPPPEPPPPELFAKDGRPLVPCDALTTKVHRERGETPTFPLTDALPHLVRARVAHVDAVVYGGRLGERPRHDWYEPQELGDRLVDPWKQRGSSPPVTLVWMQNDRFFASGPHADALRGLFAPHHPDAGCHVFELPAWIESERARRNPWRREGAWWERVRTTLEGEFGLSFDAFTTFTREDALSAADGDVQTRLLVGAELDGARATILELAQRPVAGTEHLPLLLLALTEAPLLERSRARAETLHVIGDIGAGWLLELRVFRFEAEEHRVLRFEAEESTGVRRQRGWYDGGDVRVQLTPSYPNELEGSARPARERRRQAARDAENHHYDDDD